MPSLSYVALHAGISQSSPRILAIAWPIWVSVWALTRTGRLQYGYQSLGIGDKGRPRCHLLHRERLMHDVQERELPGDRKIDSDLKAVPDAGTVGRVDECGQRPGSPRHLGRSGTAV
jgi:hypothetical protein